MKTLYESILDIDDNIENMDIWRSAAVQLNELHSVLLNKSYLRNPYGDDSYKYMMNAPELCQLFNIDALNGSILIEISKYTPDGDNYIWDVQLKGKAHNSVYKTIAKREFDCIKDKVKTIVTLLKKIRPFFNDFNSFKKEILKYKN